MVKTEKYLLLTLIVLLPTQLGYHFWPDWSLVNGVRVDYLAPAVYVTDLLIIGLMIFSRRLVRVPLIWLGLATFNVALASLPQVALYRWVRVYEYWWLYRYLARLTPDIFHRYVLKWLGWAVVWTSSLAWTQFGLQRSVGGWTYWLGERTFNLTTPGIAKLALGGQLWLRPYATLPHPNALAGWLVIAGWLAGGWTKVIGWLTVAVTFSRSALFALPVFFWPRSKWLTIVLMVITGLVAATFGNPSSWIDRQTLNKLALQAVVTYPLIGTGLGNFILQVSPLIRQPVHNIYLLLLVELGLPTTVLVLIKLVKYFQSMTNGYLRLAWVVVLLIGLVDHYWLTLHQNILLLMVLAAAGRIDPTINSKSK